MSYSNRLSDLLRTLNPILDKEAYVYASVQSISAFLIKDVICLFREEEGVTIILSQEMAEANNIAYKDTWAKITLHVNSSLNDVGLTAAVSAKLGQRKIPCNVIAAYYHDHIFVPATMGDRALEALRELT